MGWRLLAATGMRRGEALAVVPRALCSTAATEDLRTARTVLLDAFESSLT